MNYITAGKNLMNSWAKDDGEINVLGGEIVVRKTHFTHDTNHFVLSATFSNKELIYIMLEIMDYNDGGNVYPLIYGNVHSPDYHNLVGLWNYLLNNQK